MKYLATLLVLFLVACGGTAYGTNDLDPTRVYRVDASAHVTSSGVVGAECRAAGDVVLSGGCLLAGGDNGDDPNAWLTEDEQTSVGFGGWACAAWVSEPNTVAGRDHVLQAEVTCYAGSR